MSLNRSRKIRVLILPKRGIEQFQIPQKIAPSEVLPYTKQKPNTKILFIWPFYLELYNLPDSAKAAAKQAKRDSFLVEKNRRRIAKGKKSWTPEDSISKFEPRFLSKSWIMAQGEPPVILDSALTEKSRVQIQSFLFNKGYFEAKVKDSVHKRGRKAEVTYILKPGKPYKISNIRYFFEDLGLAPEIYSDTVHSLIRRNDIYDKDNFDAESDRLTRQLNNAGYYYFTKQYVSYTLDTNSKTRLIEVSINIKKFVQRDPDNKDSTIQTNHVRYYIRHVTIQMDYDPSSTFYHPRDSMMYDGLKIMDTVGKLCMKPNKFRLKIFVTPGDVYRIINREDSYTGLSQLGEFTYISVKYVPVKDSNVVDCYIQLMPRVKHDFGTSLELTNTGGDGGIQGDLSYGNYNQFRGGEKLQVKIVGGLIASQLLATGSKNTEINKYIPLNTVDFGPELDLTLPRPWLFFNIFKFKRRVNPQTNFKLSYNYQQRPDYTRRILGGSYSFDYDPIKNQHLTFTLFEVNFVNANLSQDFADTLRHYNLFLQNSFKNQVITDGRASWVITNQVGGRQKRFFYIKLNGEFSGLLFDAFKHVLKLPVDSNGIYHVPALNAPYSQYFKLDGEYRQYWLLGNAQKQKIVFRALAGWGYAYYNSTEMPFSKSFWAGGSNDIRAWAVQTLGPGGSTSSAVLGHIGDVKLEENIEYRVSLIKYFNFAWFFDAGNIWLLQNKGTQGIPLAYFEYKGPNVFWTQTAVGTGPGFRLDFGFFVIRFDIGQPIRDPSLSAGHRLIPLHDYTAKRTVYNFGIGYPF